MSGSKNHRDLDSLGKRYGDIIYREILFKNVIISEKRFLKSDFTRA